MRLIQHDPTNAAACLTLNEPVDAKHIAHQPLHTQWTGSMKVTLRRIRTMDAQANGARVLLIGADVDDYVMLAADLQKVGYMSTVAASARFAREMLAHESFDLVLLDMTLPDGNGLHFCHEIRDLYGTGMVIILMNGRQKPSDVVTALQLGADDCLTRPCDRKELLIRIETRMRHYTGKVSVNQPHGLLS